MYTKDNIFAKNQRLNSSQLSKLHTFEVAARHCSFSLSAEELSITPSAISHRINGLEDELGIQLFKRSHRKISLTSEGERIYRTLKQSLNTLNQEILEVRDGEISGTLTIYSRPSFAQCWLVPRIYKFKELHPAIGLNILTGNENINFYGHGIDVAIYFDDKTPQKFWYQQIMSESISPVCTPDYAKKHDLEAGVQNLHKCTLLHDNQAWNYDSNLDEWESWAKTYGIEPIKQIPSMGFDRSDLAVIAAINNAGIAMGRHSLVQKRIISGELIKPFPGKEVSCQQRYYVATLKNQNAKKVELFIDWLKHEAQ
ncbi:MULTISPECIES: DNA-binding transcriptional regulator DsdC [unclassified Pseudoalteromonas]|uniref:DNA-binding transcriptional regulator DsdC n=1 Tax=unclassified Pseudoalteromonas TaxID=194690 RepID=UPI001602B472|nr:MULTISPECIES: DNA-binding transcriptional regulator DsdC [unclassified Pseudoalteromonas]MBB1309055.1 DNA-binding transcriptional regulator DsdC [Pseudoalteromonas sp. SR41-8]MBB1410338.1 DNA-binding transcriptional regulator DsdC [Pseudoalteromonas sp. SG44-17]